MPRPIISVSVVLKQLEKELIFGFNKYVNYIGRIRCTSESEFYFISVGGMNGLNKYGEKKLIEENASGKNFRFRGRAVYSFWCTLDVNMKIE